MRHDWQLAEGFWEGFFSQRAKYGRYFQFSLYFPSSSYLEGGRNARSWGRHAVTLRHEREAKHLLRQGPDMDELLSLSTCRLLVNRDKTKPNFFKLLCLEFLQLKAFLASEHHHAELSARITCNSET